MGHAKSIPTTLNARLSFYSLEVRNPGVGALNAIALNLLHPMQHSLRTAFTSRLKTPKECRNPIFLSNS